MTFGVKSQKVDIVALVGGGRGQVCTPHSSTRLTALSATLQTLHHDNIGHLDIWTLVTWRHVSTHWTLDTQATLLVERGWGGGWSGLDFYDLASRGAVRWLACLVPRQVNIMELLHILHVATWPIMSTRREDGWMEQRRGEEDNLIMCNFDACTKLFQTPLLRPDPPLHRKEHSPAQLAA